MNIEHSVYNINEIIGMYERKELVINKTYQRNRGVWPIFAKTFFIDTILENFSFPVIYLYQNYERKNKRPFKEIVDGQQRFTTIYEFFNNKFKLSNTSKRFAGKSFDDLDEDIREKFQLYSVQVDIITSADTSDVLELFRRINSYTSPLNDSEKRNAEFQGNFKWFINNISDKYSRIFERWGIFTEREIVRMKDMEFIAELALLILKSDFPNKSPTEITRFYKLYDTDFPDFEKCNNIICSTLNEIFSFQDLMGTNMAKDYAIYSLFAAFAHLKYGLFDEIQEFPKSIGCFYKNKEKTNDLLLNVANAHENKDERGIFARYVAAAISSTTKRAQRKDRTLLLVQSILDIANEKSF